MAESGMKVNSSGLNQDDGLAAQGMPLKHLANQANAAAEPKTTPVETIDKPNEVRRPRMDIVQEMKARVRQTLGNDAVQNGSTDDDMTEDDDDDDSEQEWDDPDWIPTTSTGRQKSPKEIRSSLKKYLDTSGRTQKSLLEEIQVGHCTYHKFMTRPYKNQWTAVQNQTYWAAARFLEKIKHAAKKSKKKAGSKSITKRKANPWKGSETTASNKKAKTTPSESRAQGDKWLEGVMAEPVPVPVGAPVFDKCPQVVQKIRKCFEDHPGVTRASFCRIALLGSNNNALSKFLAAPYAEQQGNAVYARAYRFFEILRIREGQPKSAERRQNEQDQGPQGFSTKPYRENNDMCILVAGECPHKARKAIKEYNWKMRRQEKV